MQDFKNLLVWQKAHELALFTYKETADFPKEEVFGLRNTLRKTSVDIPAAIAEGCGRAEGGELSRAINLAIALANRMEYYSLLARDLNLLGDAAHSEFAGRIVEVRKMLSGFNRQLA